MRPELALPRACKFWNSLSGQGAWQAERALLADKGASNGEETAFLIFASLLERQAIFPSADS